MTVTESDLVLVPDAYAPESAQPRRTFADGSPGRPASPRSGATRTCSTMELDIGVKRRFRETLELKILQSLDGPIELVEGLAGSLEVWRRWSPAEGFRRGRFRCAVGRCPQVGRQTPVHDRRDGDRLFVRTAGDRCGLRCRGRWGHRRRPAGVDVRVRGVRPAGATRRDALRASWQSLVAATPCPEPFGPRSGEAMGYPNRLVLSVSHDRPERGDALEHRARAHQMSALVDE